MITHRQNECILFQPLGLLDCKSGLLLQEHIAKIQPSQHTTWIVDLAHVELIDSAGLVALIASFDLANKQQCRFVLHNPAQVVKLVLEITRLDHVFEIVHSYAENSKEIVNLLSRAKSRVFATA